MVLNRRLLLLLWLLSAVLPAQGQDKKPDIKIHWLKDAILLGEPTALQVLIQHPKSYRLIVPDSGRFLPYEIALKPYQKIDSIGENTRDSLVYKLRSFSIDSIQRIQLRVTFIRNGDTLNVLSNTDSLRFAPQIPQYNSALRLRPDYSLAHVESPPNYGLWVIILMLLVLAVFFGALFLRRPIRLYLLRLQLKRKWEKLQAELISNQGRQAEALPYINRLNTLWKSYLETGWELPLRSLTSRELQEILRKRSGLSQQDFQLLVSYARMEEAINYAHMELSLSELLGSYPALQALLQTEYHRRLEAASQ